MGVREVVNELLEDKKINVTELAHFIGVSRPIIYSIKNGQHFKINEDKINRILCLKGRDLDEIRIIFEMNENFIKMQNYLIFKDKGYILKAKSSFDSLFHWLMDQKFQDSLKYSDAIFGHINNFFPRYNQLALFMRKPIWREKYPLITYQIDYDKKMITDMSIKVFDKKYMKSEYDISNIEFPISFNRFEDELVNRIKPTLRFVTYRDYQDDDFKFILENLKSKKIKETEIYDLSRLFNHFGNQKDFYGPLIEDILSYVKIDFDKEIIHKDCHYRGDKIIELINFMSLKYLEEKDNESIDQLFDSHGLKNDNEFIRKNRRLLKKGI